MVEYREGWFLGFRVLMVFKFCGLKEHYREGWFSGLWGFHGFMGFKNFGGIEVRLAFRFLGFSWFYEVQ